jgi:hypothetical protein
VDKVIGGEILAAETNGFARSEADVSRVASIGNEGHFL